MIAVDAMVAQAELRNRHPCVSFFYPDRLTLQNLVFREDLKFLKS